jgi:type I restriction enzyme R subunit
VEISPEGLFQEREYNEVILKQRLQHAIDIINPTVPTEAKEEALRKVLRSDSPNYSSTTISSINT